jgi:hypothetical protein
VCVVGGVALHLVGGDGREEPGGLIGWTVDGPDGTPIGQVAGLPAGPLVGRRVGVGDTGRHPNGVDGVDHVVVHTDDVDATVAALTAAGIPERRRVDGLRGAGTVFSFALLGTCVLEVVGPVGEAGSGARLWGLALVCPDLDATAAHLGPTCGPVRDAVQPGRRIATLHARGLGVPVALLSPRP